MTMFSKKTAATTLLAASLSVGTHLADAQAFTRYNYASQAGGGSLNFQIAPFNEDVEGSPYYVQEWKKGAIYNKDNTFTELDQLKYNVHIDELIFLYNGTEYIVPRKEQIKRFTLGDEEFIGAFDGAKYAFYKVIEPGDKMLVLKNYHCSISKGQPSKGYIPATKDQYVLKERVYVLKPGQSAVEINPKRGIQLLSSVHDKRSAIEEFIKTKKLKMKSLEDLREVVRHYNALSGTNDTDPK